MTQAHTKRILQLAPPSGGVFDFASVMSEKFIDLGIDSAIHTLSFEQGNFGKIPELNNYFSIIFHMTGYEYSNRGLCFWIMKELLNLKRQYPNIKIAIFFHELFAYGPPWRSAFWTHLPQRYIIFRLLRICDVAITNIKYHQTALRGLAPPNLPIHLVPVFSNVGEPAERRPFGERTPQAVLFGAYPLRRRALESLGGMEGLKAHGLTDIVEIGFGESVVPPQAGWIFRGRLPKEEVSEILSRSRFGLVGHAIRDLGKSGSFAAYTAHGVVPVVSQTGTTSLSPDGPLYTTGERLSVSDEVGNEKISSNAFSWYQGHRSAAAARNILHYIDEAGSTCMEHA